MREIRVNARLDELRRTQPAVGYEEVELKRRKWRARTAAQKVDFICSHSFPAARGPGGHYFIIDGHHMALALLEEGVGEVWISVVEDFSKLEPGEFWRAMDRRGFLCPSERKRRDLQDMPQTLRTLADDPFRSLVARLRRRCGCPKDAAPFAEFRWADFLRGRIRRDILRANPEAALDTAKNLVRDAICRDKRAQCGCVETPGAAEKRQCAALL